MSMLLLEDPTLESASSDDHARYFMLRDEPGQPHVDTKVDWDKLDRLMTWESRDMETSGARAADR